ncbi:hypothetical protein G3I60_35120 [Streptomyces sp. SID13666]|uniref:hypothetical protein n=1 Tax=Streptomyces TaxID=1883 RepID=UPI001106EC9A|nr:MULTISPECIES: hypothetical protein [Streptomyces]NEA59255.1 hypothetical protein [Streptomyces sp. SID13666]NEA74198.1 hypothetical protein [Streptomyces sp. SID13588]QNA74000.1 hypothetical protein C8250_020600 [Streptomyces sp. So13.3]
MPRGRHRHSPPLHRLLPPLTLAGSAVACVAAAWISSDPMVLRAVVAAAAAAACGGAVMARTWDRAAGRRVADLTTARARDEWHADERIAELETDLDESRELRVRLDTKLSAKRAELGRLRTEHADLLRRYATAESERARALEGRRQLALEAAKAPLAIASSPVGPAAFKKADEALLNLGRNAARQQALRTVEEARRRDAAAAESAGNGDDEPQGRHAAAEAAEPAATHTRPESKGPRTAASLPIREHRLVPAVAAAVLPYAQPHRAGGSASRALGGFDFFGTQKPGAAQEDLADVVGEEAYAEHEAQLAAEVIDLTEHDETEQIDVSGLRAHSS